jgi:hypothetical protein
MGEAAAAHADTALNWQTIARAHADAYQSVIQGRNRQPSGLDVARADPGWNGSG